jgi:hypothetical protein
VSFWFFYHLINIFPDKINKKYDKLEHWLLAIGYWQERSLERPLAIGYW